MPPVQAHFIHLVQLKTQLNSTQTLFISTFNTMTGTKVLYREDKRKNNIIELNEKLI